MGSFLFQTYENSASILSCATHIWFFPNLVIERYSKRQSTSSTLENDLASFINKKFSEL